MPNHINALVKPALITSLSIACGLVACGPGRTTFAAYPSAAPAFDRAASDPKALEVADRVVAAAGGMDRWAAAKEIRWTQTVTSGSGAEPVEFDQAWDRWNGRHYQRLHTKAGDVVVMRSLYSTGGTAFGESGRKRAALAKEDIDRAMEAARERWSFDATLLTLPFLLEAPGAKLEMTGEFPAEGEGQPPLDALKLTFDPKDPTRTSTYYVMVNRGTNLIDRVEIVKAGDPDTKRLGYKVGTWVDVSGLKLASAFENVGVAGEVITFSKVAISAEPDEELYVPSLQ
jgi:hypothetical protein